MMYSSFIFHAISLFHFMQCICCECEKTGSNDGCCQDHWKQNGTCVACPPGKIGLGCNISCPENFYGILCQSECDCNESQICDKEIGCVEDGHISVYDTTTEKVTTMKLSMIYWSSLACFIIVLLIVISATVYLVLKRKHPNPEPAENVNEHRNGNNSSVAEVSEVNDYIEDVNDYEECVNNDYEECVNNDYEECTNDYLELEHSYSTIGI